MSAIITWTVVGVLCVYTTILFNALVSVKNAVTKAWANIDVLLKQRHDELPKLVDTCKQYMAHEQATLERVIAARSNVARARESQDMPALGQAEAVLRSGVGRLLAVAEAYPDLRSNEQFMHLNGRISGLENAIADRREFYNECVAINNTRIEQFPELLLVRWFGFKAFEPLQFDVEELKDVDIAQRMRA